MQNLIWCLQNLASPFFSSVSFSSSSLPNPLQDFCQKFRECEVRKINTTKLKMHKDSIWKNQQCYKKNLTVVWICSKGRGKEVGGTKNAFTKSFLRAPPHLFDTQTSTSRYFDTAVWNCDTRQEPQLNTKWPCPHVGRRFTSIMNCLLRKKQLAQKIGPKTSSKEGAVGCCMQHSKSSPTLLQVVAGGTDKNPTTL